MELRQLVYFEAVVRHGGFTRAAEHLHVAQTAVSAQVRRLEAELGITLLARTTRRVRLTEAGELFLVRARRVLGELDAARADLAPLTAAVRGRVALGATVLGGLDLPAALAAFRGRHPGVALTLRTGLIGALVAQLDAGELDVVLGPLHDDLPDGYLTRGLVVERVVLVAPPGHPLAGSDSLADFADESFVCLAPDSGLRAILDAAASTAGFRPRVELETYSAASIRSLVSAGLGVALLASSAAAVEGPPVAVSELEPEPAHPAVGLIRRRDRPLTPAADALWAALTPETVVPTRRAAAVNG